MVNIIVYLGWAAMVLTFLVSIYGIVAAVYGGLTKETWLWITGAKNTRLNLKERPEWVDSAKNAMLLTFPLLTISVFSLVYLLVNANFEVEYVSSVVSNSMPTYLRVTALWGGQPGSLVFWSWIMAGFASAVTLRKWDRDRELLPWVIFVSLFTLMFFLSLSIFFENPFTRYWFDLNGDVLIQLFSPQGGSLAYPRDGQGLSPLLRHPGMIIHPPMLYLGFVSFVIPYAFAMAALITGRVDSRWIRISRPWTLWAWMFLSWGLVLGGRWAYDVLGWGGYWGWDPVEIASFLPWLVATPFMHSVMIQEKRGMLKQWNMFLIILTYGSMIYGTFVTRSGVISSVHSFAQSAIGPMFFLYMAVTGFFSLWLLARRWGDLAAESEMGSWVSREGLFLLNNLLFLAIFVICAWGMNYPMISEALGIVGDAIPALGTVFNGQKITVGPVFYERATGPLWWGVLILMGIAPLSAWGASTMKSLGRNLWKPTLVSIPAPIIAVLIGVTGAWELLSIWAITFALMVTLYDYGRGALSRSRRFDENIFTALYKITARNRRRYGGYLIHIGIVLMALGIIGIEMFQSETQQTLHIGEEIQLEGYMVRYESLAEFSTEDDRWVARAVVSVYQDGEYVTELYPRRDYYIEDQQSITIPGNYSTLAEDFYVLLVDWEEISADHATFKVYLNPLVNWLWLGTFVLQLGIFVAAWPTKKEKKADLV